MIQKIIPNISVDCLVFGFDFKTQRLHIVLNKRELISEETGETIISDYTLAGHHILEGETADEAAKRVVYNITGFDNLFLEQFHTFSKVDRLSGEKDQIWIDHLKLNIPEHVFTVGYYALVNKNKLVLDEYHQNAAWFPIDELPPLGFDHEEILEKGIEFLRKKFKLDPIAFELLPERFTMLQLHKLYEAISGITLDNRNFRKKVAKLKYIIPLDEKQKGVAHKPAQVFLFSKEVYEKTKKEKVIIN